MQIKVGMVSLGCSKNQVDAERMLALLKNDGYEICPNASDCNVVIVNTCGFIEDAKKESIENILEYSSNKNNGKLQVVVATGCLAERYREEMANEMPEVNVVLGIGKNSEISSAIARALAGERVVEFGSKEDLSMEGARVLSTAPYTAYLKIAEGCDNRCSYCAIPLIRGGFRSRRMEDVLLEARELAINGVSEINLVAQDTSRYGEDIYGKLMLPQLLEQICEIPQIHWVRILYCYPQRVTDELLQTMANNPKIVKYIDLPIQHVTKKILAAMNRRGDPKYLSDLIANIRNIVPEIAVRTTIIAGFPGESAEDFEQLCNFVSECKFDRLGCFAYSREEDTPAYNMPEQIDDEIKLRRVEIIMEMQIEIAHNLSLKQIGKTLEVLCEGFDAERNLYVGRSYMDAPDVDTKVYFSSARKIKSGEYINVNIISSEDYDLIGELI